MRNLNDLWGDPEEERKLKDTMKNLEDALTEIIHCKFDPDIKCVDPHRNCDDCHFNPENLMGAGE